MATAKRRTGVGGAALRTRDVARLLGCSPERVRAHVHAGLCRPSRHGRAFVFSFQDLVLLRSAQGLLDAGVAARRVRRALSRLAQRLGERPLSSLRFRAHGQRIIVHDGAQSWNSESGQLLFSFDPPALQKKADVVVAKRSAAAAPGEVSGADWFEHALALEESGDLAAARKAYRAALGREPRHADACVNLGRLLHQEGGTTEAGKLYERALAVDADDPVAHYNLALVREDQARPEQAIEHYRRALQAAPDFADAHYNLARLFEEQGRHAEAARHLIQYTQLTGA